MAKKKVLVACGTGIATSTVVANKVKTVLKEQGIDVEVLQCKVSELSYKAEGVDLIVTTTPYNNTKNIPVVVVVSFLTGIGIEADVKKIVDILKD